MIDSASLPNWPHPSSPIDGAAPHAWSGRGRVAGLALVCLALAALAVAGCSSKSGSSAASTTSTTAQSVTSSTYPAGKEAVCQARDQLKTSITALTKPTLLTGGSAAIKTAVDQVQTDLDALKAAAKTDYQPQVGRAADIGQATPDRCGQPGQREHRTEPHDRRHRHRGRGNFLDGPVHTAQDELRILTGRAIPDRALSPGRGR